MRPDPWIIGDTDAWERLQRQVLRECQTQGIDPPEPLQVAAVLHALADHEGIMQALTMFRPDTDAFWPEATAIGRWLHAYGDYIQQKEWG